MDDSTIPLNVAFDFTNSEEFQLIYASQLYQTFFAVFAKFTTSNTQNPNKIQLDSGDFFLINYKGIVNLGLLAVSEPIIDKGVINIYLKIKAFENSDLTQKFTFKNKPTVTNNDTVIFHRELVPFTTNPSGLNENFAFDEEFYNRDGLTVEQKEYRYDDIPNSEFDETLNSNIRIRRNSGKPSTSVKTPVNIIYLEAEVPNKDNKINYGGRCPRANLKAIVR